MTDFPPGRAAPKITLLGKDLRLPRSRRTRTALGAFLMFGGFLGFLPVLGFWMLPLGLLILSYEYAWVRRRRRRMNIWWGKRSRDPERKRPPRRTAATAKQPNFRGG